MTVTYNRILRNINNHWSNLNKTKALEKLQIQNTHWFCSQQNGRIFTIFLWVNCKNNSVTYLLEFKKCHIQYAGKAETNFNLRLKNHRKDVYIADVIPAPRIFLQKTMSFNTGKSFIIIEKIRQKTP